MVAEVGGGDKSEHWSKVVPLLFFVLVVLRLHLFWQKTIVIFPATTKIWWEVGVGEGGEDDIGTGLEAHRQSGWIEPTQETSLRRQTMVEAG